MKKHHLTFAIIFASGIIALALFLFLGKLSDSARADFYRLKQELDSYRTGIWRLEKLDPHQLEQQLQSMNNRFLSVDQLGLVIGELTELAKTCNVSIISISPSEKVDGEEKTPVLSRLSRVPIEMRLSGKYEQGGQFLSQLSTLKHAVMKVDQLRLEKESGDSPTVLFSMMSSIYVRKTPAQKVLEEEMTEAPFERKAEKSRYPAIDRDPFTKRQIQLETKMPISLQGILYDAKKPIALVNGEAKGVGEVVNDMKIVEIQPDGVVFEKGGKKTKMQLRWD